MKNSNNRNNLNKGQKGRLPHIRNRGKYMNKGMIGLSVNKSMYVTPNQIKALRLAISYLLPKNAEYGMNIEWKLTSKSAIFNKGGNRMGRGKGSIKDFCYKIPKGFIIVQISYQYDLSIDHTICKLNKKVQFDTDLITLNKALDNICSKLPFLSIFFKS